MNEDLAGITKLATMLPDLRNGLRIAAAAFITIGLTIIVAYIILEHVTDLHTGRKLAISLTIGFATSYYVLILYTAVEAHTTLGWGLAVCGMLLLGLLVCMAVLSVYKRSKQQRMNMMLRANNGIRGRGDFLEMQNPPPAYNSWVGNNPRYWYGRG